MVKILWDVDSRNVASVDRGVSCRRSGVFILGMGNFLLFMMNCCNLQLW
jgi:hypothetical protein